MKFLRGNAPVIVVQEIEDGRDEWRDFSNDRIAKYSKVFGVYRFDYFLDYGSFEQCGLGLDFFLRRCVSFALAIWAAVPAGFGTRMPVFGGRLNGLASVMR